MLVEVGAEDCGCFWSLWSYGSGAEVDVLGIFRGRVIRGVV